MYSEIIKNYPNYEREVLEFKKIAEAEDYFLDDIDIQKLRILNNQFVLTADTVGLSMLEKLYNIVPLKTETIEQRRIRILLRMQLQPPYTLRFLRGQLDKILGEENYELEVDYDNYTISISSGARDQFYAQEISAIVGKIKPCNMRYIYYPLVRNVLSITEEEYISKAVFNYRLGTRWNIGQKPFVSSGEEEVIKMAEIKSIQQNVLNDTANFLNQKISKAKINDSIEISNFDVKKVDEENITIEYAITEEMQITFITNIKLLEQDGTVFANSNVYIPITGDAVIKHKIKVQEGE